MTCYNYFIYPEASIAVVCAGNLRAVRVFSQTAACTVVAPIQFYQDLANCLTSTPDWAGVHQYYGCGAYPTIWGELDYDGDNIGNGSCGRSDIRLKKGVETLKDSLEKLMKIDVVEYDWNNKLREYDYLEEKEKLHTIGLIAQNVKEYYPEVVSINSDGYYWVNYVKLNAVLVEAIKEQQVFIEDIDKELEYIESKLK